MESKWMACWHFLPFFQVKAIKFRKLEKCHHHPADTFPEMSVGSALIIRKSLQPLHLLMFVLIG